MFRGQDVDVNGNGNIVSGRDTVVNLPVPKSIRFYEKDIKQVIEIFSEYVEEQTNRLDDSQLEDELIYVEKTEKNKLNSLSDHYFKYIVSEHLTYFQQIDEFLKDPKNNDLLKKYLRTAKEINFIVHANRNKFDTFDDILLEIYQGIEMEDEIAEHRNKFILFLNYMYWNCDIGRKS